VNLTTKQIENVQIDYGIVYTNYGETDAERLGPARGGGEFKADAKIRDIEFDGSNGKTEGMQVVESIDASLKITLLDTSIDKLALSMPYLTLEGDGDTTPYSLAAKSTNIGVIPDTAYLKNITMFCKTVKGEYRKITLYNAMAENGLGLKAKPKGEGELELEFNGHWKATDDTADLFKIETVATIAA
jgi:hypothetical protein